jgi:Zn ribbon nucleic-acid-binding protein
MDPKCPACGASDKFGGREVSVRDTHVVYIVYCTACGHIVGVTPKSAGSN